MPPLTKEAGPPPREAIALENPSSDKGMADYNENRKFQSAFLKWQTVPTEHKVYATMDQVTASPLLFMKQLIKHQNKQTKPRSS